MTSLHADDAFLSYYQLSHDPFTPRVPGFKFYPAQRKPVLGQLHHLARYGQLLLLVTGPKGSGKTLLRQALVASTNKQSVHSLVLSGRESTSCADVLRQIATGIESASPAPGVILTRAGQLALTGQEIYLLVDDAGYLEDEALQALLALAAGNAEGRIHVFLFAEDDLVPRLARFSEGEEGFHAIELQPYSDAESREYLSLRLEGAGQSLDLLTDDQLAAIHSSSCGWPGAINRIARETLIDAMLADRDSKGSGGLSFNLPKKHVFALILLGVVVGAAWLMSDEPDSVDSPVALTIEAPAGNAGVTGSTVEFTDAASQSPAQPAQPVIREPLAQASGELESDEHAGTAVAEAPAPSDSVTDELDATEPVSTSLPLPLPTPSVDTPSTSDQQSAAQSQAADVPALKPLAAQASASASGPVPPAKPALAILPPATKPAPKVASKAEPQPLASQAAVPAGSQWYKAQASSRFALQILATRSESSAKAFVKQNGAEYRYFMKMHQGAPLYVVTYGVFSSQSAAQAALKALPAKVRAGKPWPKAFGSIQQEMAKGP